MKVMVTGGAGYIGSHAVKALGRQGHDVVVVDNLSTGFRDAVLFGRFYRADLLDRDALRAIVSKEKPDAVMHFAASIIVPESVEKPLAYYRNNVMGTITLLDVMRELGINRFIFSSTAAVYGIPRIIPAMEDSVLYPINPYGSSKAMMEQVLKDYAHASKLKYVVLRYFNVAGADPDGQLGERKENATHLITVAARVACRKLPQIQVYGTDYETPDGTCIRDYIHVSDLAEAHVLALEYLQKGGPSDTFNCGYGRGASVLEVIETVKRVSGNNFKVTFGGRRAGDPPALVAGVDKIKDVMGFTPRYADLAFIIRTAWEWEKKLTDKGESQCMQSS